MMDPDRYPIGYARVSTDDQVLQLQLDALVRYGVPLEHIVQEKVSGKSLRNRKLAKVLNALRPGDRIVVWKLDRLGRSVKDLIEVIERIERSGADLVSLTEGVDTTTAMGRFFFHIMAAIAELERAMISERTKAGIAAKKAQNPGKKWGSKHWLHDHPKRQKRIQRLYDEGAFSVAPRETEMCPDAVRLIGMMPEQLRIEANKADRKAKEIENAETIRRWLREGVPGLDR